jgi:hypothetical protein
MRMVFIVLILLIILAAVIVCCCCCCERKWKRGQLAEKSFFFFLLFFLFFEEEAISEEGKACIRTWIFLICTSVEDVSNVSNFNTQNQINRNDNLVYSKKDVDKTVERSKAEERAKPNDSAEYIFIIQNSTI